jgi:DNA-binding NtrC family response regulator
MHSSGYYNTCRLAGTVLSTPALRGATVKAQLESLVLKMYQSGICYSDAVAAFKRCFIETALRETRGHQINAARRLGIHRNSLARNIAELQLDVHGFRPNSSHA